MDGNLVTRNLIEENLLRVFNSHGIYLDSKNFNDQLIIDSLQFINIILAIEDAFHVEISEGYYDYQNLNSFNDFIECIQNYSHGNLL